MKLLRTRVRAAAVAPVVIVAFALGVIFLFWRIADLDDAHRQRALALGRQLAASAEFPLFADDRGQLSLLVERLSREPEVVAVAVLDRAGKPLVTLGELTELAVTLDTIGEDYLAAGAADRLRLIVPILAKPVEVEAWYATELAPTKAGTIGYVRLDVGRDTLRRQLTRLLMAGVPVTLAGMALGLFLAMRLALRVIRPVCHIGSVVDRLGQGDLDARVTPDVVAMTDILGGGINRMAEHLASARRELEHRVATATEELRQRKDEAESATLAKSRVLSSASHDLRQPLHALGMFVARLRQIETKPEALELVGHMEQSVGAMQGLLNALLDLARLDAGAMTVDIRPFPVSQLLTRLIADLAPRAEAKSLNFRVRPSDAWFVSDPELFYRILLNLAANAVAYTVSGGVLVACRPAGTGLRIEVWDSGIGIPLSAQAEVFKEFVQLDNPHRDRNKGLGLGLAIVERTSQLLGHRIALCSEPGRGTRFTLFVPRGVARVPSAERRETARGDDVSLDGLRALIIDDDPASRQSMALLAAGWGCAVTAFANYHEALSTPTPDVIVCDFRLVGEINGIDAILALRQRYGAVVPACLISGDTDVAIIQSAASAGLPLLHKPIRPARLQATIRRLARRTLR